MSISEQKILTIGGSSGIGLATARMLVDEGADVTIASRSLERLDQAKETLGGRVQTAQLDVSDEAAVRAFFADFGPYDHLVTSAAGSVLGPFTMLPTDQFRSLVDSKFWGQYYAVKYGVEKLNPKGSITLFSGTVTQKPLAGASAFAAVGAAMEAVGRTLALELAPRRVNTIVPGIIDTPAWDLLMSSAEKQAFLEQMATTLPVGRVGTADDVAATIVFAIKNGFVNGTTLVVDGGHRVI